MTSLRRRKHISRGGEPNCHHSTLILVNQCCSSLISLVPTRIYLPCMAPTPSRKMMRQIAGAFAEYEKARLVSKLRHARERVRQEKGKCEGRKPHVELRPEAVALAKRLHRAAPRPASA